MRSFCFCVFLLGDCINRRSGWLSASVANGLWMATLLVDCGLPRECDAVRCV